MKQGRIITCDNKRTSKRIYSRDIEGMMVRRGSGVQITVFVADLKVG